MLLGVVGFGHVGRFFQQKIPHFVCLLRGELVCGGVQRRVAVLDLRAQVLILGQQRVLRFLVFMPDGYVEVRASNRL